MSKEKKTEKPLVTDFVNLMWCEIRFGHDMNWWVKETNTPVYWDGEGALSIIDPRQMNYILDLLDILRDYGLSTNLVESAFVPFQLQKINSDKTARLVRVNESFFDTQEELFALPDVINADKRTYADFLEHITKLRVMYLNDKIAFEQKFTVSELEDQVRENQTQAFMEGREVHLFQEIIDILEFVPEGFEIKVDDDEEKVKAKEEDDFSSVSDIDDFNDEKIEEDETMHWDSDDDDSDRMDESFDDEPIEKPKSKRGRKKKIVE